MLLIHSNWTEKKSFRLIPLRSDCPFVEMLYDPTTRVLVIISKITKENMHMVPKVDALGDVDVLKAARKGGKMYKEERKILDTFQEYYVHDTEDIKTMINMFAINSGTFDYGAYMTALELPEPEKAQLIVTP